MVQHRGHGARPSGAESASGSERSVDMSPPESSHATLERIMVESPGKIEISCESCGARVVVEPLERTSRCPYCDSPSVVDRPATEDRP